jgi:hypothetical protein
MFLIVGSSALADSPIKNDTASCRQRCWEKWSACTLTCNGKTDNECGTPCYTNKVSCEKDCETR